MSHYDVAHLHTTNIPTRYQFCTPYSSSDIIRTRFEKPWSLRQGQEVKSKSHHYAAHLHPPNNPTEYQLAMNLWFPRYSLDVTLKVKVTMARPKVKSFIDIAYLHPLKQCPYQNLLAIPCGFRDTDQIRFKRLRLTWYLTEIARGDQGDLILPFIWR